MQRIAGFFLASLKLTVFFLITVVLIPFQIATVKFFKDDRIYFIPRNWHNAVCRLFGIKVIIAGTPRSEAQTLFVANHISYLDIPVISGTIGTSFVAKDDVRSWPLFGFLAMLQNTVFISRSRKDARKGSAQLHAAMQKGCNLVLFAEGTSSDGSSVLPFKSSLFSMILDDSLPGNGLMIQPVSVELVDVQNRAIKLEKPRDLYAWYGDMELAPHLWQLAQSGGATIKLHFHASLNASAYKDRKLLAKDCHEIVASIFKQKGENKHEFYKSGSKEDRNLSSEEI